MTLQAGYEIGPYRVLAPIGAGGMGEVYRARDTKLDRDIALKILPPDVASVESLRRFEQEARAASSLNHPNIVAIYDVGRYESIAYIAMELVEGQTVRGLMASGPMQLKEALRVAAKVADVLASAHERGVTHRDLKPENVMIARDGYVKLLDFGLAKVRLNIASGDRTQPLTHTTAGHVFGTAAYMSPEQAAGRPVDFRSDQFSLGIILYEMVGGKRPFDRETNAETLTAIIREEPPPLPTVSEVQPRELQQVLSRCLAKSPHDRYASTRDLARDLRDLRNRLTASGNSTERSLRTFRMNAPRLPVIGAITAVLLVVTGATMVMTRNRPPAPQPSTTKSLAIVPFRDLSGAPDGQILSDGISEMISARIGQARGLRVLPLFEGTPLKGDPLEIARRRGASLLLTGVVQQSGESLRLSFQVRDANTGGRVAGDMVTGRSADIFIMEDLVADSVLQSLNIARKHRLPASVTLSAADQQSYAQAIGLLQRMQSEESLDRAKQLLEGVLVDARDSAAVNGALGKALLRKYSLTRNRAVVDEAAVYAERAVQLDDSDPDASVTLGELQRISGKLPEAKASFEKALMLQPQSVDALLGLADTLDAAGNAADADRIYRQAVNLRPDYADVYGRYGRFCYARGRFDDAARLFRKQTEILPEAPRGYSNLGAALTALQQYPAALQAYQKSIDIHPTSSGYSNLGTTQVYLGQYANAAAAYEKAAALSPDKYNAWLNLADTYRWNGDHSKAAATYERAIRAAQDAITVNPNDAVARAKIAAAYAKLGQLQTAQSQLQAALKLDPTNPLVLYQAAIVANIRGDRDATLTWLQRSIASGRAAADVAHDPEMSNLRNDPRFRSALKSPKGKT